MGLFKTTIDSIISDIKSKIEKLHLVAELHADAAKVQAEVEAAAAAARTFAENEYARAKAIAAKFEALIKG
ncbi:MAG TPA: hypothetical protein VNZ53_19270 [Steroidobacteraceae bacterium]|nr:hypothetical protein [Steroidobacteraceae bacterium]